MLPYAVESPPQSKRQRVEQTPTGVANAIGSEWPFDPIDSGGSTSDDCSEWPLDLIDSEDPTEDDSWSELFEEFVQSI